MSGTFSSFGSALSALRYNRVAMDTASNNVANAHTPGYTRRVAIAQATGAPAVQALWSTWNGAAGGVEVGGVERMADLLLDRRSRVETAALSFLTTRTSSLTRFETTLGEPGDGGIAAALSAFKQGWGDVANNPGDEAARSQLLGRAGTLVASVESQVRAVTTEWADQRTRVDAVIAEVNQVAKDLAELNKALQSAYVAETDANTLLDQRDQLAQRLATLTGAQVSAPTENMFSVTLNGHELVTGTQAYGIGVDPSSPQALTTAGQADVTLTYTGPGTTSSTLASGKLSAHLSLLNEDLPDHLGQLDTFVSTLVTDVNGLHATGVGLDDPQATAAGRPFFTATTTAAGFGLEAITPRQIAAARPGQGTYDATIAQQMGAEDMGATPYRSMITNFGVKVASQQRLAENQAVLAAQVDATRESLSGVNIDEEMVNLLAAQRAYEGASRVITTLDSVLDTLINRTGLTR